MHDHVVVCGVNHPEPYPISPCFFCSYWTINWKKYMSVYLLRLECSDWDHKLIRQVLELLGQGCWGTLSHRLLYKQKCFCQRSCQLLAIRKNSGLRHLCSLGSQTIVCYKCNVVKCLILLKTISVSVDGRKAFLFHMKLIYVRIYSDRFFWGRLSSFLFMSASELGIDYFHLIKRLQVHFTKDNKYK